MKSLHDEQKKQYVFTYLYEEQSKRVRSRRVNEQLKKWGKQAGLKKKLHFHVSRHTFATLSLTYGTDLYTVSKLLGHSDIRPTAIYANVIDKKKSEAVAK